MPEIRIESVGGIFSANELHSLAQAAHEVRRLKFFGKLVKRAEQAIAVRNRLAGGRNWLEHDVTEACELIQQIAESHHKRCQRKEEQHRGNDQNRVTGEVAVKERV